MRLRTAVGIRYQRHDPVEWACRASGFCGSRAGIVRGHLQCHVASPAVRVYAANPQRRQQRHDRGREPDQCHIRGGHGYKRRCGQGPFFRNHRCTVRRWHTFGGRVVMSGRPIIGPRRTSLTPPSRSPVRTQRWKIFEARVRRERSVAIVSAPCPSVLIWDCAPTEICKRSIGNQANSFNWIDR